MGQARFVPRFDSFFLISLCLQDLHLPTSSLLTYSARLCLWLLESSCSSYPITAKALCAVIYFTVLGDKDSVAPLAVWVGTVSPGTSKLQDRQTKVTEAKEVHQIVKLISGKLVAIENPLKINKHF